MVWPVLSWRLIRIDAELRHRHGGDGAQVMRIENVEKRLGDLGEFVIDLVMDAPGYQGKGLDEALDVRVLALIGLKGQPPGDLGIARGKFLTQAANETQLVFVVREQVLPSPVLSYDQEVRGARGQYVFEADGFGRGFAGQLTAGRRVGGAAQILLKSARGQEGIDPKAHGGIGFVGHLTGGSLRGWRSAGLPEKCPRAGRHRPEAMGGIGFAGQLTAGRRVGRAALVLLSSTLGQKGIDPEAHGGAGFAGQLTAGRRVVGAAQILLKSARGQEGIDPKAHGGIGFVGHLTADRCVGGAAPVFLRSARGQAGIDLEAYGGIGFAGQLTAGRRVGGAEQVLLHRSSPTIRK